MPMSFYTNAVLLASELVAAMYFKDFFPMKQDKLGNKVFVDSILIN